MSEVHPLPQVRIVGKKSPVQPRTQQPQSNSKPQSNLRPQYPSSLNLSQV